MIIISSESRTKSYNVKENVLILINGNKCSARSEQEETMSYFEKYLSVKNC